MNCRPPHYQSTHDGAPAIRLSWKAGLSDSLFNIYSSREWPVDTENPQNLIATHWQSPSIVFQTTAGSRFFAITALDRYGNESLPLQQPQPAHYGKSFGQHPLQSNTLTPAESMPLLHCDNRFLTLPNKPATLDADHIIIETLQGRIAATLPYRNNHPINVTKLPPGNYIVRSLNHRGITHRLGFFQK